MDAALGGHPERIGGGCVFLKIEFVNIGLTLCGRRSCGGLNGHQWRSRASQQESRALACELLFEIFEDTQTPPCVVPYATAPACDGPPKVGPCQLTGIVGVSLRRAVPTNRNRAR